MYLIVAWELFFNLEESISRDEHLKNSGIRLIVVEQNLREEQQFRL
jgi:hypothetical protein